MTNDPKILDLDADGYLRWIRARTPPFEWFLGISADQQEALAEIGDRYTADVAEYTAECVAAMILTKGLEQIERELPALDALDSDVEPMTFAGSSDRKKRKEQARALHSFLGRPPDILRENSA